MQNEDNDSTIGIFKTHVEAENSIKALEKSGFKMDKLSIVGRDYQSQEGVVGYYNAGDRMKYWGKQGAFWGGIWGVLFGSAFFWIPAIGPILVAGPLVASIVGGLEGAVVAGGVSALGAGLFSIGIPKNSIVQYEAAIKAGEFVLIAHGTADQMEGARKILKSVSPGSVVESFPHVKGIV